MSSDQPLAIALTKRVEILREIARMTAEADALGDLDVVTFQRLAALRTRVLESWPEIPDGPSSAAVEGLRQEARALVEEIELLDRRVLDRARRLRATLHERLRRRRTPDRSGFFQATV
jgi:hypothetical protein